MSKYFEIVIFTAALKEYADWILNTIDSFKLITHRLYRQHTTPHEDYAIKDLTKLGRNMERILIVDNLPENFIHNTPNNGIWIHSWYDDMDDIALTVLGEFLKEMVIGKWDVREILTKEVRDKLFECMEGGYEIPSITELI